MTKLLPDLLNPLIANKLDLIQLNRYNDKDENGKNIGKAPAHKGWRRVIPLTLEEAKTLMIVDGYNIGVRLNENQVIIDVDPRNFIPGDNPLKRLCSDLNIDLENIPTVVTGSGGLHVYLSKNSNVEIVNDLHDYKGIEFKSLGRQIVAPGSIHPETKGVYRWKDNNFDFKNNLIPNNLLEIIKRSGKSEIVEISKLGDKLEEYEFMLNLLDPTDFSEGNYDKWLRLMMSCHHATGGEGRIAFLNWCMKDKKYSTLANFKSNSAKWDSLSLNVKDNNVTYKYLFGLVAKKNQAGRDYIRSIDFIPPHLELPDYINDCKNISDLNEILATLPPGDKTVSEALEWFNREGFAAVMDSSCGFRVMRLVQDPAGSILSEGHRHRKKWESYRRNDFLAFYETKRCQDEKGSTVLLANKWLAWDGRRSYEGVVFDPSGTYGNKKHLNLWTGFGVEPQIRMEGKRDCSLLYKLLLDGLCGGDEQLYEYCLNWAAFLIQYPHKQAEVAIVFKGKKGTGKGTFARALMTLCGRHSMQISNQYHLTGHFNAHLRDCIFMFVDEAMWAGDKKAEGELKRLITEPELTIEAKGKDVISANNMLHVMMASNEKWVVPASGADERRYFVVEVTDKYRNDIEFFNRLNIQLKNGGYSVLLWDLKTRDISSFTPRSFPTTKALVEQKLLSLSVFDRWWYSCLCEENITFKVKPLKGIWDREQIIVAECDLLYSFNEFMRRIMHRGSASRYSANDIYKNLQNLMPDIRRVKTKLPNEKNTFYFEDLNQDGTLNVYVINELKIVKNQFIQSIDKNTTWENICETINEIPFKEHISPKPVN